MVGMAKVCSNDVERQHGGVEESGFAVSPGLNFRQGIKYSRPLCKGNCGCHLPYIISK